MTRKADSTIVKLKRKVIKLNSDLNSVADELTMFLGYHYRPSQWDSMKQDFDEEAIEIHETTEKRYQAAQNVVVLKAKKRQLRKLSSIGSLSKSQIASFANVKDEVAKAIHTMSGLPDLGTSQRDWDALPAEFKSKNIGHPKVTLEETYLTVRSELNLAHKQVNDIETEGSKSTIDDILSEEDKIAVNAGRKKLPDSVAMIEEFERKKRSLISQIEDIKDEPVEQEVKTGRGKRKLSKEVRLEKKTSSLAEINLQIQELESALNAKDYALRSKRILEREKRYAKENKKMREVRKIEKRLSSILDVIENLDNGKITDKKAREVVFRSVNAVDLTIESTVQNIIDDAATSVSTTDISDESDNADEDDKKSISEIFESIELPRF